MAALEGDLGPQRGGGVVEFPSYERAWAWYHSPAYAPLRALRESVRSCDVVLVEGLAAGEPVVTGRLDDWERERLATLEVRQPPGAAPGDPV